MPTITRNQFLSAPVPIVDGEDSASQPPPCLSKPPTSDLSLTASKSGFVHRTITERQLSGMPSVLTSSSKSSTRQPSGEIDQMSKVSFDTFTWFPKLPYELRRKIFKESCKEPGIYNLLVSYDGLAGNPSSITNRSILYASSESRASALEVLKPIFNVHIKEMSGQILISSQDIIYLNSIYPNSESMFAQADITFCDSDACLGLSRIAFNTDVFKNIRYGLYKWLKGLVWTCPTLEFILVDRLTVLSSEAYSSFFRLRESQAESQPIGSLQLFDLEEVDYKEFDGEMKEARCEAR